MRTRHFNEDFYSSQAWEGYSSATDPLYGLIADEERAEMLVDAILALLKIAPPPSFERLPDDQSVDIDALWRAVSKTANNEEW